MKDKIQKDLIESMKSGSKDDVEILRFVISLIKKEEKDKNKDFSDSEVIPVSYTHLTLPTICSV